MDFIEIEQALEQMQPRQKLYEIVKAEMIKRGRWRLAPRGIPFQKQPEKRKKQ